jgi:hypothetical protein
MTSWLKRLSTMWRVKMRSNERYIDPKEVPKGDNMLYIMYQRYSKSKGKDKKFRERIDRDVDVARKLGVKRMTMEANFRDFRIGDYDEVWSPENYKYLVESAHKRGIEVYVYVVIGEVATHSKVYKKYRDEWTLKWLLGQEYSGFNSVMLQDVAYDRDDLFQTNIFCIGSPWRELLIKQLISHVDKYNLDGVYIDRVCYRIRCRDKRHGGREHFNEGIPIFLRKLSKELKERKKKMMVVDVNIKPSASYPDEITREYVKIADSVLLEVISKEFDIQRGIAYLIYSLFGARVIWRLRHLIKHFTGRMATYFYNNSISVDPKKFMGYIKSLKELGAKDIIIFSASSQDPKGFNVICDVAKKTNTSICFVPRGFLADYVKE